MADLFMGFMAIMNLVVIAVLYKVAITALKDYIAQKKKGLNPQFKTSSVPGLKNAECWDE